MFGYRVDGYRIENVDVTSTRVLRLAAKVFASTLGLPRRGFLYVRRLPDGEMVVAPLFGGFFTALARSSQQRLDVFVVRDSAAREGDFRKSVEVLAAELKRKLGATGCTVESYETTLSEMEKLTA